MSLLFMWYVDNYYISANAAARWYFNPQIPEARHFYGGYFPGRDWMDSDALDVCGGLTRLDSQVAGSVC